MRRENKLAIQDKFTLIVRTFLIGLFGGLFIMLFFVVLHYFNMLEFNIYTPWRKLFLIGDKMKWYHYFISTIMYSFLSIILAFIYYIIGKKRNHWDIGALFGIMIAIICYVILPIVLYDEHLLIEFTLKTHLSFFIGAILFGMFIGYSISYEYYLKMNDNRQ